MIQIENIAKRYRLGGRGRHDTLRDLISDRTARLLGRPRDVGRDTSSGEFWAIRDVTFDVAEGEVIGIIGRNGAGKSTLLKILSRITPPTKGRIRLRGRVASLLEVGTGFHPELTGLENIFMNGSILGMRRAEIRAKLDEIIDFSEVAKFIDTPVKHYSSGMYVRLAFAVAAHLEPEILIVDEVLAVGDIDFQRKCLGKLADVTRSGRTVIFVSHNMAAVQSLCHRALILKNGAVFYQGDAASAVTHYVSDIYETAQTALRDREDREGNQRYRIIAVRFIAEQTGAELSVLVSGMSVRVECEYEARGLADPIEADVSLGFYAENGTLMFACRSSVIGATLMADPGGGTWILKIQRWPLNQGSYRFTVYSETKGNAVDWVRDAGFIKVETGDFYGTGKVPAANVPGVFVDYKWEDGDANNG